jgi:hypothetical protein
VGSFALRFRVTEGEPSVVEALKEQDNISESVVDGKDNLVIVSKTL